VFVLGLLGVLPVSYVGLFRLEPAAQTPLGAELAGELGGKPRRLGTLSPET
jgi:hypothetical protein